MSTTSTSTPPSVRTSPPTSTAKATTERPTSSTSSSPLILAVITAMEVTISYVHIGPLFLPVLLILMAVKFVTVVSYFMHLKFDNRIFSFMFYMGLIAGNRRVLRGPCLVPFLQPLVLPSECLRPSECLAGGIPWRNTRMPSDRAEWIQ